MKDSKIALLAARLTLRDWLTALVCCLSLCCSAASATAGQAVLLSIDGAIGPATEDYLARAFQDAIDTSPAIIIIRVDTPGGLDTAMRGIIQTITASPVPVATYVSPTGARAASAGTYILLASHIAAMAPGTNLGAATPVQIGGISLPGMDKKKEEGEEAEPADKPQGDAMQHKIINDAAAYIRGLAALHGRNEEWAEQAVRQGLSLQAREALALNVIDIIATDITDLLVQIDGRKVKVLNKVQTLHTSDLTVVELLPDWRSRLLNVITNPNVAYILMMIGIYGLILEFYNPGGILPGTVGAICLLLALYSFQLLPVNYAGVGLILLGAALMVAEAFQPSFGVLGLGGLISFVIGSIVLMDTQLPAFTIYLSVILTFTLVSALVFFLAVGMALRARKRPVVSGVEQMIGERATVIELLDDGMAMVAIHSERWRARSAQPLHKGEQVRVKAVEGLKLDVEPLSITEQ
ncbi:MAG: nodulation protein NfeD [Gammaproteobacteria bacterium]|nr:nodulation protein NfeD [Gammaproteobacteria bacterium]MBQ0838866.1 nodulation protein NfeD [Gammaproteobacteria bacterium]